MLKDSIWYLLHRRLFAWTNGRWNDFLSFFIRNTRSEVKIPFKGILEKEDLNKVIKGLNEKGYYVFDQKLSSDFVDDAVTQLKDKKAQYITKNGQSYGYSKEAIPYKEFDKVDSNRFQYNAIDLYNNTSLSKLLFDSSLAKIAKEYFKSTPILDLTVSWWSKPSMNKALKDASAQMYHYDMDRIKFLKFFFYLTDVNEQNGPHCFIKGTHKRIHSLFRKRGRAKDEDIKRIYSDDIIRFMGEKGSILAVDTRGLHKGEELVSGERLIFQIQFTNSMFGKNYPKLELAKVNNEYSLERIKGQSEIYLPCFK